jgi:hypothetical protein
MRTPLDKVDVMRPPWIFVPPALLAMAGLFFALI